MFGESAFADDLTNISSMNIAFHTDNSEVSDHITGFHIIDLENVEGFDGSIFDLKLVYAQLPDPADSNKSRVTIAASVGHGPGHLYLLTNSGPEPVPREAGAEIDQPTMQLYRAAHGLFAMRTEKGQPVNVRLSQAEPTLDLSSFGVGDEESDCIHFPGPIAVNWNGSDYSILARLPAPTTKYSYLNNAGCSANHGSKYISQYATVNGGSTFYPAGSNIYVQYLHYIYVIPIDYLSPESLDTNGVAYQYSRVLGDISKRSSILSHCGGENVDCFQKTLDAVLKSLSASKVGNGK
jgi:hypothetical protein